MKSLVRLLPLLTAASLLPLSATAQVAGTATATTAPGAAAKKAGPLSSDDKQLVKTAADAQLGMLHLAEVTKGAGSESLKTMGEAVTKDVNTAWGELGAAIKDKGTELPKTDPSASEKKEAADLKKLPGDKFDKAFLKVFAKEAKHASLAFGNGVKSASDPELKAYFAKWQVAMAKFNDQADAAEKEAGKKK